MTNSAVRIVIRIKRILIKAIMDTEANIFIIILLVIKKLRMIMRISDKSKIIAINQIKKNVISIIKDASFFI